MSLNFGRKIISLPLLICLLSSLVVGYCLFLITGQSSTGLLFGILCLVVSPFIFSINLTSYYGFWQIDDKGLHYYDYGTTGRKFRAILLPMIDKEMSIDFNEIKSFSIVASEGIRAPEKILGGVFYGYTPDVVLSRFPTAYYLSLKLADNQEVDLDLAFNLNDTNEIEKMIQLLESKTNLKVNLVRQKA